MIRTVETEKEVAADTDVISKILYNYSNKFTNKIISRGSFAKSDHF